jgi:hypothetical protein
MRRKIMPSASGDLFSQRAYISVTESVAGTLSFQQLTTGAALFERRAMVIHRMRYFWRFPTWNLLLDTSDYLFAGLSTNGTLTSVLPVDPNVIDFHRWQVFENGAPASSEIIETPTVLDFTTLPGGGKIIPAFPVYGFVQGVSLASVVTCDIEFDFTARVLKAEEYIELVEASRVIT